MASLAELSELVGFFSYSRRDDERSGGALSALRRRIHDEIGMQLGRDLRLWQDTAAIPHGTLWQDEIDRAVAESVFFIPIVTPSAVGSEHCKYEFDAFLARESVLARHNLVFPILYIQVPGLEIAEERQNNELLQIIHARQYFNWTAMRHRDLGSPEAAEKIEQFCGNICSALRQRWISPDERRRQEELEASRRRDEEEALRAAQAEAARQREAREAAEGEARRRREEDERLAAERRRAQIAAAEAEDRRQREAREAAEAQAKRRREEDERLAAEQRRAKMAAAEAEDRRKAQQAAIEAEARRRQEEERPAEQSVQRDVAITPEKRDTPVAAAEARPRRARFAPVNLRRALEGAALPVLILILWQVASSATGSLLLPAPTTILSSWFSGAAFSRLAADAAASMMHFVLGGLAGAVAWVGIDRLVAVSDRARVALRPLFRFLCAIPAVALIPLLALGFGFRSGATVTGAIATFLALIIECTPGFRREQEGGQASAAPQGGFAAATAAAFSAVLAAEMYASNDGLGHAAADFMSLFSPPLLFSAILIAAALSSGIRALAGLLDRFVARRAIAAGGPGEGSRPASGMSAFTWSSLALGAAAPILILVVWQLAYSTDMVNGLFLPSPGQVAGKLFALLASGVLAGNAASTIWQLIVGVLLSLLLVLPVVGVMELKPRVDAWLRPLILILGAVPPVMWILPAVLWLGYGSRSHIFAATVGASFAALICLSPKRMAIGGAEDSAAVEMLRSPGLLAGARQVVRTVLGLLIVSEFVASLDGLGRLMADEAQGIAADAVFACLVAIGVIGLAADTVVVFVFRRVIGIRMKGSGKRNAPVRP